MKLKIYQINLDRDEDRIKFMSLDTLPRFQKSDKVNASIYDEVFSGEIEASGLEDVYRIFNTTGHPLHRGHSLAVSDMVVTEEGAYYCDSVGFQKVDFDESLTRKPDNLMRIVYVEPQKAPYVAEVAHTLKAEQRAVGGDIEAIDNGDGTCIIGNAESKLMGLKGNRYLDDGHSIMAGAFFICGTTEEDFRGLTDEEVTKYMDQFQEPDDISQEEVESDMGFSFITM